METGVNRLFIAGSILLVVISIGLWVLLSPRKSETPHVHTNEELVQAIIQDVPSLSDKGKPLIAIESVLHKDSKWYVVTIKSLRSVKNFVPVKVVLLSNGAPGNRLRVTQGPDVHFSDSEHNEETASLNMPDWVVLELEKS
jgi:hypothetical protein